MGCRECRDCGITFPIDCFPVYSGGRGHRPMCRTCFNISSNERRKYRRKHGARSVSHLPRYRRIREKYETDLMFRCEAMVRTTRQRARKKGLDCNLTAHTIFVLIKLQSGCCAITKIPFSYNFSDQYTRNPYAPSIDRKDSKKGYTVDNIQIVTTWYNMMKNEWSDDDVRTFIWIAFHSMFEGS